LPPLQLSEMSLECAFRALQLEMANYQRVLPFAAFEMPAINLLLDDSDYDEDEMEDEDSEQDYTAFLIAHTLGYVDAPSCPAAGSVLLQCTRARVKPGDSCEFMLKPQTFNGFRSTENHVLVALASAAFVEATTMAFSADEEVRPGLAQLLPVTYLAWSSHGGVVVNVDVPATVPEGSRVVIRRASIAGCNMDLGTSSLGYIVGFNHAPAVAGSIFQASLDNEHSYIRRMLYVRDGPSTEETDNVSSY
jgi:hypothetical protein